MQTMSEVNIVPVGQIPRTLTNEDLSDTAHRPCEHIFCDL